MQLQRTAPFRAHAASAARPVRVVVQPRAAEKAVSSSSSSSGSDGGGSSSATVVSAGAAAPAAAAASAAAAPALAARCAAAAGVAASALVLALAPLQADAFGPVSVQLKDLSVERIECGPGVSSISGVTFSGASQKPACLQVTAQAVNPSKTSVYDADVFGRVYDKFGEAAIDDTENIRIAYIDEVQPGRTAVKFKLYVPLEQYDLGDLKLVGFKATGFPGRNLPASTGGAVSAQEQQDCEITGDCDDLEAAAAIR